MKLVIGVNKYSKHWLSNNTNIQFESTDFLGVIPVGPVPSQHCWQEAAPLTKLGLSMVYSKADCPSMKDQTKLQTRTKIKLTSTLIWVAIIILVVILSGVVEVLFLLSSIIFHPVYNNICILFSTSLILSILFLDNSVKFNEAFIMLLYVNRMVKS